MEFSLVVHSVVAAGASGLPHSITTSNIRVSLQSLVTLQIEWIVHLRPLSTHQLLKWQLNLTAIFLCDCFLPVTSLILICFLWSLIHGFATYCLLKVALISCLLKKNTMIRSSLLVLMCYSVVVVLLTFLPFDLQSYFLRIVVFIPFPFFPFLFKYTDTWFLLCNFSHLLIEYLIF